MSQVSGLETVQVYLCVRRVDLEMMTAYVVEAASKTCGDNRLTMKQLDVASRISEQVEASAKNLPEASRGYVMSLVAQRAQVGRALFDWPARSYHHMICR